MTRSRRPASAISRYKAARRQIKRTTGLGVATKSRGGVDTVEPIANLVAVSSPAGDWYVMSNGKRVAGAFDTKGEAEEWISAR